jgi:hypothetical protein
MAGTPIRASTGRKLPGYSRVDSIPALLSPGEWIIRSDRARMADPLLRFINYGPEAAVKAMLGNIQPGMNAGGMVSPAPPVLPRFSGGGSVQAAQQAGPVEVVEVRIGGNRYTMGPREQVRGLLNSLRALEVTS